MKKGFAFLWRILGVILFIIPLLALLSNCKNYALYFPWVFSACCFLLPSVSKRIAKKGKKKYRRARAVFLSLFFAFLTYFGVVIGVIGYHARLSPPTDVTCDILLLGSGVKGTRPDILLRERLDEAVIYLTEHKEARVFCCGGKSPFKEYSEAEVMRMYLVDRGIEESRIFKDEKSTSTQENIAYAKEIIEDLEGEERPFAVCSSNFHLYRAKQFAKKEGLGDVYGLPARTPTHLVPAYWIREFFGVSRMWILGF